jgi:hypothetical protein
VKRFVVLLLASSVLLSGCLWNAERRLEEGALDEISNESFYSVPDDIAAGEPGQIVRSLPILSAPLGVDAWRLIYHTTDVNGKDVLSSAVLAVPAGRLVDADIPIVSWGHPTTGAAQDCAPSILIDPFLMMTGLSEFIAAGYAMVATDYPGMAVRGDSSYALGSLAGRPGGTVCRSAGGGRLRA